MHQNFCHSRVLSQAPGHPLTPQHQGKGGTSGPKTGPLNPSSRACWPQSPLWPSPLSFPKHRRWSWAFQPCPETFPLHCTRLCWVLITRFKNHMRAPLSIFHACEESRDLQGRFVALATTSCGICCSPGVNTELGETQDFWESFAFKVGFV